MNGTDSQGNAVGTITMTELKGIIPAKTGAVLRGGANTYNFIPSISYGTAVESNMLVGYEGSDNKTDTQSVVALPTDGSVNYVLTVKDNKAGFFRKDAAFNVYNNKAYLNVPASDSGARSIILDFGDDATGIDEVETENGKMKTEIYDLSGRRSNMLNKGIYIVNGKKVVVK